MCGCLDLDRLILLARDGVSHARPVLVAVDGRSGVGKTTFAAGLALRHAGAAITADDFYAGGDEQTWSALSPVARADRVIDWQRLRAHVLEPLLHGRTAQWHTFDWQRGSGLSDEPIIQRAVPVIVLDEAADTGGPRRRGSSRAGPGDDPWMAD